MGNWALKIKHQQTAIKQLENAGVIIMTAKKSKTRQQHGVMQLAAAINTVNNKAKGIAENAEEINVKMREILDIIDHPVKNRRIEDYE